MNSMNNFLNKLQKVNESTIGSSLGELLYGTVISVDPIRIQLDNTLEISHKAIVLSVLCEEFKITTARHNHYSLPDPAPPPWDVPKDEWIYQDTTTSIVFDELLIWRGLIEGDRVLLTSYNNNQRYFVHQRLSPLNDLTGVE